MEKELDLHGYHPYEKPPEGEPRWEDLIREALEEAQAEGADFLRIIHGHGHWRHTHRMFANTNTGFFGLAVRRFLRGNKGLRHLMYAKINVGHDGSTVVRVKRPKPGKNVPPSANRFVPECLSSLLATNVSDGDWEGALYLSNSKDRISLCRHLWFVIPPVERPDVLAAAISEGDAPVFERPWLLETLRRLHEDGSRLFDCDHARIAFDALPDPLPIYRGTTEAEGDQYGVCWTVSREVARFFAAEHGRFRNTRSAPIVLSTTVYKERVTGFMTERDESEVIVTPGNLGDVHRVE